MISRNLICLAIGLMLSLWLTDAHSQSSSSYEITKSVMAGGGTTSTSASYSLTGILGQPSPVGVSESPSFSLGSGFWGATVRMFTVAIQSITYNIAEGARITWHSIAEATYTIEFTDKLTAGWTAIATPLTGTGG
ncbi:hypothetical protein HQ563_12465, partial [bacterium]|nr:hypothetical protein [bacterium]